MPWFKFTTKVAKDNGIQTTKVQWEFREEVPTVEEANNRASWHAERHWMEMGGLCCRIIEFKSQLVGPTGEDIDQIPESIRAKLIARAIGDLKYNSLLLESLGAGGDLEEFKKS